MTIWQRVGDTKYSSPIPNSLQRRTKKTQGTGRAHGKDKDGRATGAGAGTETSAHQHSEHVHSLLSAPHHHHPRTVFPVGLWAPLEDSGLMPGSWARPLWPGSTKPPAGSWL